MFETKRPHIARQMRYEKIADVILAVLCVGLWLAISLLA